MRAGQRGKSSNPSRQEAQEATKRGEFKRAKTLLSRLDGRRKAALTPTLKRLMACINDLDEDKLAELRSLVNEKELAIIERRVLSKEPATLKETGKSFPVTRERIRQIEEGLLTKIERWKQGKKFGGGGWTKAGKGPSIERIRGIIEERISKGEILDEIKKNARLNETEREVLDIYILAEDRITQIKTAMKLGKSFTTIAHAVRDIRDKLLGKFNPRHRREYRYERVRRIIEERLSRGETLDEIKKNARLNETEREVLDVYLSAEGRITHREAAKKLGKPYSTIAVAVSVIENKLLGKRHRREYRYERIRRIIEERLSRGQSLDEIKKNARLNETEREVLDVYVLAEYHITHAEAAKRSGKSPAVVSASIHTITKKL